MVSIRVDSRQNNQADPNNQTSPTGCPVPRDAYSAPEPGRLTAEVSLTGWSQPGALHALLIVDKRRAKAAFRIPANGTGMPGRLTAEGLIVAARAGDTRSFACTADPGAAHRF